jgi:hypothetical protein
VALYHGLHMTSIGTKNGSVIVKNGSVAENCNCCNASCCCEFVDMRAGGVIFRTQADSSCVSRYNRKLSACNPIPITVNVSGVVDASWSGESSFQNAANKSLSFANTSQSVYETCGQTYLYVEGPSELNSGFFVASSRLYVITWFSPYDVLRDSSAETCNTGKVRMRVEVTLERIYRVGSYSAPFRLLYTGYSKTDCTDLDSYPSLSSMLSGKSATMTCDGSFTYTGGSYTAQPQTITVSFDANPLP